MQGKRVLEEGGDGKVGEKVAETNLIYFITESDASRLWPWITQVVRESQNCQISALGDTLEVMGHQGTET